MMLGIRIISDLKRAAIFAGSLAVKPISLLSLGFIVLAAAPGHAQEPLNLFKNYFITGDYVVRGTSLWRKGVNGKATVDIPRLGGPDGVTPSADIVAAFLYIQTAEKVQGSGIDHVKFGPTPLPFKPFLGNDFGPFYAAGSTIPGSGTIAKALNWDLATLPCWTILYPGGGRRLVTYRADVLRFLPIDRNTGKQALNTSFRAVVPDSGIDFFDDDESSRELDKTGPRAVGVSLVVVYRDPAKPFKAIVIYDGGLTKRAFATMSQTIKGFYDAGPAPNFAKMTHIVGDGRPILSEKVTINGQVSMNPFRSLDGPKWDNWTVNIPLTEGFAAATVKAEPNTLLSDCVSWSAIILSTNVRDTDGDGLLDAWETSPPPLDATDPKGILRLPDLAGMGATLDHKDLFVEIGYLKTDVALTYGLGNLAKTRGAHTHLPTKEALDLVGKAFENAPTPIKVHFDVGNNFQPNAGETPDPYIIPASLARGGEAIDETHCDAADPQCQYPDYPGTVGWKRGFRFLRDQILSEPARSAPPIPGEEDPCDAPGNLCVRRFDDNRHEMFRYVLFAHALGLPTDPCLNPNGSVNAACQTDLVNHPGFHIPRTNSGIADFPGGDLMVTLGAFDDPDGNPVGKPFMQASTLMHELGHTFELTHAGTPLVPREPNCKPNYLSVMNYLFQLRGLITDQDDLVIDFSRQRLPALNEFSLSQGVGLGRDDSGMPAMYRTGWYAPKASGYLKTLGNAATAHCDGSPLLKVPDPRTGRLEPEMVRLDAPTTTGPIDWNANGTIGDSVSPQDINFNGVINSDQTLPVPPPQLNAGSNDWTNVHLNQTGSRRNVGGIFADPAANGRLTLGPLSLDIGRSDIGRSDIGRSDIGRSDIGRSDIGRSDIGSGDLGQGDIGRSDIGRSDIGRSDIGRGAFGGGDLDVGAPNEPAGELDLETFKAATGGAPAPPNPLKACLTSDSECFSEGGTPVLLTWQEPNVGTPVGYSIYRFTVNLEASFPPGTLPSESIADLTPSDGDGSLPTHYFDYSAPSSRALAYFVIATFEDGSKSGISNFARITTPSAPPPIP